MNLIGYPQASLISESLINNAVICNKKILFTTHHEEQRLLRILDTALDDSTSPPTILYAPRTIRSWTRDSGEVTCIAMYMHQLHQQELIVAGERKEEEIFLLFITDEEFHLRVPTEYEGCIYDLRALASIIVIPSSAPNCKSFVVLCGTLTGLVISLEVVQKGQDFQIRESRCDRFGGSVATLTYGDQVGQPNCLFVNCDEKIFKMTRNISSWIESSSNTEITRMHMKADQIWLVDALNTTLQQPSINSISSLRSGSSVDTDLLLISYNRLLLARMGIKRKTVPRRIPIKGTPYRIIHSECRNAFVVGASIDGKSTLYFIDPETGEDLSDPRNGKRGESVSFVSGLGHSNDKVLCVYEWLYSHNDNTWNFLVVCTSGGRVLIISTTRSDSKTPSGKAKISFWTVTKFKNFKAVYSAVGDSEGLYYCAKNGEEDKLYYSTLNKEVKKFDKNPAEVKLISPAISLSYDSGKIYALTRHNSLQILEVIKTNGTVKFRHTHTGKHQFESLHHLIGRSNSFGGPDTSQVEFVSNRSKSVVGLWATQDLKINTLDTLFEARLPASILRFRSANCRPVWDSSWRVHRNGDSIVDPTHLHGLGAVPNDDVNSETLGLGIDGSLYHFTMLDFRAWNFLSFMAELALCSGLVGESPGNKPMFLEPDDFIRYLEYPKPSSPSRPRELEYPTPSNPSWSREAMQVMHVDGDILKRVVEKKLLIRLLCVGTIQDQINDRIIYMKFVTLLEEMHEGRLKTDEDPDYYIEQAYEDLRSFLRPVI